MNTMAQVERRGRERGKPRGAVRLAFLAVSALLAGGALLAVAPSSSSERRSAGRADPLSAAKVAYVDRDFAQAEKLLREAIAVEPKDRAAALLLGRVLLDRGTLAEARSLFSEILKADPKNAEAARGMGAVYRRMGQLDLAIACWTQAAELKKNDAQLWKDLGLAQREKGDFLGALSSFQESLALDKSQGDLTSLMVELATGKNDLAGGPPGLSRAVAGFDPRASRGLDPESLIPRPRAPDPTDHFPRPGGRNR